MQDKIGEINLNSILFDNKAEFDRFFAAFEKRYSEHIVSINGAKVGKGGFFKPKAQKELSLIVDKYDEIVTINIRGAGERRKLYEIAALIRELWDNQIVVSYFPSDNISVVDDNERQRWIDLQSERETEYYKRKRLAHQEGM